VFNGGIGIVEQKFSQIEEDADRGLIRRRIELANVYQTLPEYRSIEFWKIIGEPDIKAALPLEILVRCFRVAIARGDDIGRNRIIEVIFRRTQSSNECWAYHVLNSIHLGPDERNIFVHDLFADLCERVIRALMDRKRLFWEENFQHCLQFERKHTYQAFMTREGRWYHQQVDGTATRRIPRVLIESLDQPVMHSDGELWEPDIEDERAQQALLSVERSDLPLLILQLPEKLKSVIWLIFWEGRTEKDAAQILGITDRTVRNRLREALKSLRDILDSEGKTTYG
jgi:RNA polymerase sigma factor (sigma-70 family)